MALLAVGSNLGANRSGQLEHPESRNPQKGIGQLGLVHGLRMSMPSVVLPDVTTPE